MKNYDFSLEMKRYISLVESSINKCLVEECPTDLIESMRYSLVDGGKRIRPVLLLAFFESINSNIDSALDFACALEMIHTYSLIHDDLPCMDNDDYRRGRKSNHIVFGYPGALLAGDALLNYSFELMLSCRNLPSDQILDAASYIASCSGKDGMILGQSLDLFDQADTYDTRSYLSLLKTSCLLRAACVGGLKLAGCKNQEMIDSAIQYADNLGLAFQIRDDILDVTSSKEELGKSVNSDINKKTFVSILGIESAQEKVIELTQNAKLSISSFSNHLFLADIADMLVNRKK